MTTAFGTNWSQWRGPNFNGTSNETGLPAVLDPNNLLWKMPLPGFSAATPVVFDGRMYLPSTEKDSKRLLALCMDAATGKVLWKRAVSEANQRFGQGNTMASSSACADGNGAAFLFADGTLIKFSPAGEPLWRRNITELYGPLTLDFGFSSSPLLHDGKLYISVLRRSKERRSESTAQLESYLLCVDHADGETVFKYDRPTDALEESTNAYTTPIPATFEGKTQIVVYGGDYLTGHDPDDGHELWRYRYSDPRGNIDRLIPSPVADEERVYCTYPRGLKTFAVRPGDEPEQAWVYDEPGPDISSPTLYQGYLYQVNEKQKTLTCLEAVTGAVQWIGQLDRGDMYYASITAADGKLYLVNRRGTVTVADANPKEFKILSTLEVGEKPVDASIVVSGGRIYLRTAENLYCWGKRTD
jgi:outer membrane protein assembly factor BamB